MDISTIFSKTFALYTKTHFYHIRTIGMAGAYNFHQETGSQWEELVDAVDAIGEQVMILDKKLEIDSAIELEAKTLQEMKKELVDDLDQLLSDLIDAEKTAKDGGTKNLLGDQINARAKNLEKLKSI